MADAQGFHDDFEGRRWGRPRSGGNLRKAFIVPGRRIISGLRSSGATHFRHKHTRTPSAAPVRCPFSITVRVLTGPTREKTGPERGPRRDADGFDDPRTPQRRPRRGISRCVSRRGAGRQDQEPDGGVLRPRQDHRPDHLLRGRGRRDGAVRRAPDDAAGLLFAPADREPQNTTAFVEVDEVTLENKYRRIFTGWMFASSPGLHGIEHPIYDIWLTDCKGGSEVIAEAKDPDATPVRLDRRADRRSAPDARSRRRRFARRPAAGRPARRRRRRAACRCSRRSSRPARFFPTNRGRRAADSIPPAATDSPRRLRSRAAPQDLGAGRSPPPSARR